MTMRSQFQMVPGLSDPTNCKVDPRMREQDDDCFAVVRVGRYMVSTGIAEHGAEPRRVAPRNKGGEGGLYPVAASFLITGREASGGAMGVIHPQR